MSKYQKGKHWKWKNNKEKSKLKGYKIWQRRKVEIEAYYTGEKQPTQIITKQVTIYEKQKKKEE